MGSMDMSVVVTGIGIVSPMDSGKGLGEFWRGIISGRDTAGLVTSFDAAPYSAHTACEVRLAEDACPEPAEAACGPRWLTFLGRAFRDAAVDSGADMRARTTGLYVGTVLGGILEAQKAWAKGASLSPACHLYHGIEYLKTAYHLTGPATTISTACASGTDAIGMAYRAILRGETDLAVAGGVDTLSEFAFSGFSALRALTREKIRPFDKNRDGLVLGEGACLLVLEEERSAVKRGANIYGRVMGYASRADGRHLTAPDRDGRGLGAAIVAALKEAGTVRPDYINAHGTGTAFNDAMETTAIKLAFGKTAYDTPISSIKSMIGHSFGAGGAIEAAACLLAIKNKAMPPTINYHDPDPDCDLDYIPNVARHGKVATALSLSAGFGGQNAAIIFGE